MSGDRALAVDAGCQGYIAKPIDTRTFGNEVRRHIAAAGSSVPRVAAQ